MSPLLSGLVSGLLFGAIDVGLMLPMSFPDKKTALLGSFFFVGLPGSVSYTGRLLQSAIRFLISFICVLPLAASLAAEDASIGRLVIKLPRAEKLIKPSIQKTLEQPDPALKDSLATEI